MKVAYTVVSLNYLPYARALAASFSRHNPDFTFYIGMLERKTMAIEAREDERIVMVEDLEIPEFETMNGQYSIFELSCALKPFFADYFFSRRSAAEVIYLDSDILVFSKFRMFEQHPDREIFITPHLLGTDGRVDEYELHMLAGGIINGGFTAYRRGPQTLDFLNWWKMRMTEYCYQGKKGLFVDQLWLNLVPGYFDKSHLVRDVGYNVAYWNLDGRQITASGDGYVVNDESALVFFHYSGYRVGQPDRISVYQDRLNFSSRPDIKPLFDVYVRALKAHDVEKYASLSCSLGLASRNRPAYKDERNPVTRALKKVAHKIRKAFGQ